MVKYKGRSTLHTTTTRPSATQAFTTHTMFYKAALVLVLTGVAIAAPSHQPTYKEHPMPHSFEYNVKDDYAGTDFGHSEDSDGKTVRGSYNVQLPDGRKQTVNYEADHYKGFVADVQYYGEAQYPYDHGPAVTYKPQYQDPHRPQPTYQPQPSYQPHPSHQPEPAYN
ncbi:pupal cuticle protein Edg-84A-like [Panulirus ornatus]|uniref:pupal cuticle protein Edg-84A-like n=1 Tax=Panulirus ornatus TaxID=150431 RepID=UPI003A892ED0